MIVFGQKDGGSKLLQCRGLPLSIFRILSFHRIPMACLIGMAYQSNLLSSLVMSRVDKAVDNYEDILEQNVSLLS